MFLEHLFESYLSSEEVDHGGWEKNTYHRDSIDEIETSRKEEESDKDEWCTWDQCEATKSGEEEIDDEKRASELFEKMLQWFCPEEERIVEVVWSYAHDECDPDDDQYAFDPEWEYLEHYCFSVMYITAGQKFRSSKRRDFRLKYRFTSFRFWNAYWYCM